MPYAFAQLQLQLINEHNKLKLCVTECFRSALSSSVRYICNAQCQTFFNVATRRSNQMTYHGQEKESVTASRSSSNKNQTNFPKSNVFLPFVTYIPVHWASELCGSMSVRVYFALVPACRSSLLFCII